MLWKMAAEQAANHPSYEILPGPAKRHLFRALVLAASASFETRSKEEYWKLV